MEQDARPRFQGKCLLSKEGYRHMKSCYDRFPASIRRRLQQSTYNLCAACVAKAADRSKDNVELLNQAIDRMEQQIRTEELRNSLAD